MGRSTSFSIEAPSAKENCKRDLGNFVFNLSPGIRLGCWCSQPKVFLVLFALKD